MTTIKSIVVLACLAFLYSGCMAYHDVNYGPCKAEVKKKVRSKKKGVLVKRIRFHKSLCKNVLEAARLRGSLTLSGMKMMAGYDHPALKYEARRFWSCVIRENLLPFNALFFRALRDRDFGRAELVRKTWLKWLTKIEFAEPEIAKTRIKNLETFVIPVGNDEGLENLEVSIH